MNASLQHQTCGLCGTFNDMKEDDFHLRSGDDQVDLDEFAKEWLIPGLSQRVDQCRTESVETSIDYCDIYSQRKTWAMKQCSTIKGTVNVSERRSDRQKVRHSQTNRQTDSQTDSPSLERKVRKSDSQTDRQICGCMELLLYWRVILDIRSLSRKAFVLLVH